MREDALKSSRVDGLDTLRALAIVGVMLFHLTWVLPERWSVVGQFGWMGVDLFFVLSGYLIGVQMLRGYARGERGSMWGFYRRRGFRILPAYLLVVGLYEFVPGWREFPGLAPVWELVTFTENLRFDPELRAFSHVWSLCVEEHFYLVLPWLVMAMMVRPTARKTAVLVVGVVLGGVVLRAWAMARVGDDFYRLVYYPTWMRLDGLVAGVTVAVVRVFRPRWWAGAMRRGYWLTGGGVVLVGMVMWAFRGQGLGETEGWPVWGMVFGLPMLAAGLGLLVMSAMSEDGWLRVRVPGARLVATLAFALYLTHKAVVHGVRGLVPGWTAERDWRAALVYGVSCFGVALALHVGVERPFVRLRERLDGERVVDVEGEMRGEPAL